MALSAYKAAGLNMALMKLVPEGTVLLVLAWCQLDSVLVTEQTLTEQQQYQLCASWAAWHMYASLLSMRPNAFQAS